MNGYTLRNNFESFYFVLKNLKKDFVVKKTTKYKTIIYNNEKFFFGEKKGFKDFQLIKKVEKDARIEFLEKNKMPPEQQNINFVRFNDFNLTNAKILKIDIKAAYWYTAFYEFLQEETFLLGIENKRARLSALGSLATQQHVEIYEKGLKVSEQINKKWTRPIYFLIAKKIDNIMNDLFILDNLRFGFYVDCIFCSVKNKNIITEYLQECNYFFSINEVVANTFTDQYNNKYLIDSTDKIYFIKKGMNRKEEEIPF